jgi:hypothetical protein
LVIDSHPLPRKNNGQATVQHGLSLPEPIEKQPIPFFGSLDCTVDGLPRGEALPVAVRFFLPWNGRASFYAAGN